MVLHRGDDLTHQVHRYINTNGGAWETEAVSEKAALLGTSSSISRQQRENADRQITSKTSDQGTFFLQAVRPALIARSSSLDLLLE